VRQINVVDAQVARANSMRRCARPVEIRRGNEEREPRAVFTMAACAADAKTVTRDKMPRTCVDKARGGKRQRR